MATLTPNYTVTQSIDGKKLTFKDTSDWSASGLDINDYVRTIELYDNKDATGNLIDTITFTGSDLEAIYTVTEDRYYSGKYQAIGGSIVPSKTLNFGTTNFEYKQLNILMSKGCGCGNKANDEKARFGFIFLKLAERAIQFGNAGQFNQNIKASHSWLTT